MTRWLMLLFVIASAAAAGVASRTFAVRAPVQEAVGATQWAVVTWFAGAFLVATLVVVVLAATTKRIVRWRYKVFNPFAVLASCAVPVGAAVWIGYSLLVSVPAAKLELLVGDLTNREPKLLKNARPFSDQLLLGNVSNDMVSKDVGFLRGLNNAGEDFRIDGKAIIDGSVSPYQYPPLADPAAERLGWDTVTGRLIMKDTGDYRRPLVIIGNRSDFDDRKKVHEALKEKRQQLSDLSATNGAHRFLRDAADRIDDLVSRLVIDEPTPPSIDALTESARMLASRSTSDLTEANLDNHIFILKSYIAAIAPAIDAVRDPNHVGLVIKALKDVYNVRSSRNVYAKDNAEIPSVLAMHVNASRTANPRWWADWKKAQVSQWLNWTDEQGVSHQGLLPTSTSPFMTMDKLGAKGRNQCEELDKALIEFKTCIELVLNANDDGTEVQLPVFAAPGAAPGSWTPAGVEALIKERLGLQRWSGQTYPNGQEVLLVIQSEWAALWQRINPQNTPKLDDAVRAAQAIAMSKIKLFLRRYGDDLRKRIQDTKGENYQKPGRFREPFRTTPPFSDDNYRKRLREEWLVGLVGISPATIDSVPQPPTFAGQVECTKDACALAERAVECFDRVCGESSKPADVDWMHAGLWWLIFFGGPGDKPGFNPFEEASVARQPATIKGTDGKDIPIGGLLSGTDDKTLESYGQPKPAATTPTPSTENKPPVK